MSSGIGDSILYAADVREEVSSNGEMGERSDAGGTEICPYLGMKDDPTTRQAFPSEQNRCFRGDKGQPIEVLHQQQYCLHVGHRACPVFRADEMGVSERYGYVVGKRPQEPLLASVNWRWLALGVLSLALLLGGVFLSRPLWQESDAGLAAGEGENEVQRLLLPAIWVGGDVTVTPVPATATTAALIPLPATPSAVPPTIVPSPTPAATQTAVPSPPPTFTPAAATATGVACGPPAVWVRYPVQWGDTIYSLARERGATVTAVLRANCLSNVHLEAGRMIYLPPLPPGFPSATPAGEANAPEVTYLISAPAPGSRVSGQVAIRGTVDFAPGQVRFYKVEIGEGAAPAEWTTLGRTHTEPIQNGVLEELWVDAFPPGLHTVRLVLVRPDGNYVGAPYQVAVYLAGGDR